ncbi:MULTISPECIES: alpha/beta fold hydrolase [Bradyrhizobium]|jgi:pimeloyl-ACP methyl ester carboxylesterase|uniref:Pimeloyl-ACP methyl ester carboxylesterase n=2 Tax=Bradyrhizobium TaxID=374 RepID=A0ABY0QEF8_9BRAD|nr:MULTISPECIES: alpha/beta hydrolase [Bradyrhizobium]SDK06207.1 Pimeloyl-ACP methyl ester carboxylesterase [Bradyrhizobium ottawaense]SEB83414.1 Pimeloyl-ACP methyl ester carboxylesterase [Bradyrhizobium lablabi]
MTSVIHASFAKPAKTTVLALHCSLGSGRQWTKLADELGRSHHFVAPDISGYGTNTCALDLPLTLAEEVRCMSGHLNDATGPIHLVGHSYGGAIAFKIATDSAFAHRVRSLTLIEPVLPTLLLETDSDRRLHARFAQLARDVSEDLWNGSVLEAIDQFIEFWNGSGPQDPLPATTRLRMIERADKLAFDFTAALAEENVTIAAASLRVPTLLFSGGTSPYFTQRIVRRLAAVVEGAESRHLPDAGHMLALSHASTINPEIAKHIARADALAGLSLGRNQIDDPQIDVPEPPLRLARRAVSGRVGEEKS